jgi:hypothetical protein
MAGRSNFIIGWIAMAMAFFLIAGCRSSTKQTSGEQPTGVETVGLETCFKCHSDGSLGKFPAMIGNSGTTDVGWLYSGHGNYEARDQNFLPIDLGIFNDGFPFYAFSEWNDTCATCHDQLGDGQKISTIFALFGPGIGEVNRPVVGCESCHGAGGNHFGLGPIPYPKPDPSRCGQCHTDAFPDDHLVFHPEADRIYEDYLASPHSRSIAEPTRVDGSTTDVTAQCSRCHTDEGVKLYVPGVPGTASHDDITAFFGDKAKPDVKNASAVGCRTCHDVHHQGKALLAGATTGPPAHSEEFNTCTTCHQLLKSDETLRDDGYHAPYDKSGATVNRFSSAEEIIADTHYDDPSTPDIEGYIVNPAGSHSGASGNTNQGACTDCHNPHQADATINRQWARSAHGGFILDVKEAATNAYTAAVTETDAVAWVHYDFKSHPSRDACQRCHTSTGFRNFANSPTTYNPANNVYVAASNQKEMLYCWACHISNKGDLRNPGEFVPPDYRIGTADVSNGSATVTGTGTSWSSGNTPVGSLFQAAGDSATYIVQSVDSTTQVTLTTPYGGATAAGVAYRMTPYLFPSGREIAGISGSFVCVSCHSGRETGEYIKSYPGSIATNFGSFNSHYLAAGGVLFRTIGYEYSGLGYSNPANFAHDTIGVTAAGTGANGPCVGCHMKNAESHLFLPTTRDETTDEITAITSGAVCETCHGASPALPAVTPTDLNNLEAQYDAALEALQGTLNTKGICWTSAYPYFNVYDTNTNACSASSYTAWADKDTLGAAFNMNMLEHMPMAFVHNSLYTRRLIFDSIDWLDSGTLDGDVGATINGLSLTDLQKADALAFLGGGARP